MSIRLKILNFAYRLFVKPLLRRAQDPVALRDVFERSSKHFRAPVGFWSGVARYNTGDRQIGGRWAGTAASLSDRTILLLHGGGFVAGSSRSYAKLAAQLAGRLGASAFVPDYRLAPENPFPAGCQDVLAVYAALLERGYDPTKMVLAGDSGGGNLVLALLSQIKEQNLPMPAIAVLMSPVADLTFSGASITANADADTVLPVDRAADLNRFYLGDADPALPLASPLFVDMAGFPPTLIQVGSTEILLSDAERVEQKLRQAGVVTELQVFPDCPHVWQLMAGKLPEADLALNQIATFCNRYLPD